MKTLDVSVGGAGFTSEASSSSAVAAHGATATETAPSIHTVVSAFMEAVYEAITASVIPSSGRIFVKEREEDVIKHVLEMLSLLSDGAEPSGEDAPEQSS